jgi:cellulose synthase operon protein C
MADSSRQTPGLVEEVQTAEFTLPPKRAGEDDPLVPTLLSGAQDRMQETRQLIVAALRELEASGDDDRRRARIHHTLGLLIEHRLGDRRRAANHYLEACRLAPGFLAAIRSARRLFWAHQNWSMVLRLLDEELAAISSPVRSAQLLFQKGRIFEERLLNSTRAREHYEQVLKLEPGHRQALIRLRRLLLRAGDARGLLEICRRTAAATKDRKYRGLMLAEMARILETDLKDLEAAIATYSASFVEDPTLASARSALKRLYHQNARWGELVDVLLTEAELAHEDRERVQAYLAAARLSRDNLGQSERALEIFARVRRFVPDDGTVLKEMAELLQRAGRHAELCEVYQQMLEGLRDSWERVLTHYRLGQVLEERLNREDEAIVHYRRAVSLDQTYVPALQALGKLYQRRGLWAELIAMNAAEAETVAEDEARAARFASLAELCEQQLQDRPKAIEFHRRALACRAHYPPSERALRRLYPAVGDDAALADLLESQLARGQGIQAARLHEELGRLFEERLHNAERAADHYGKALPLAPDPQEAASTRIPLLQGMQRVCAALGRHEELLRALDDEIAHTEDPALVTALQQQGAELCETKLRRIDEAVARYGKVLEREPAHWPALSSLGRIYNRQGRWGEVLALYEAEVAEPHLQPARAAALLYKMGEVQLEHLADEPAALASYSKALEKNPHFLPALEALAAIYRRREDWDRLLQVMRRQADVLSAPEQKATATYAIGELCETRLGQRAMAAQYYRQALEIYPPHELAMNALLRILSAEDRWREVVELYARALTATTDDGASAYLLKQMGRLWEEKLMNPARAMEHYEQALALQQDDLEALEALSRLCRQSGATERLASLYERLALRSKDSPEAIAYLCEAASTIEAFGSEQETGRLYEQVVQLQPDDIGALEALARLYTGPEHRAERARVCDGQIRLEDDAETRAGLLLQLATAREEVGDLAGAGWALGQASEIGEDWVVARELRRLRERLAQWDYVALSLEEEARLSRNRGFVIEALMRAAVLHQDRFSDLDRAAAALTKVLELDPFHEDAALRLEQILVKREAWTELVDVLRRRLEAAAAGARPATGSAVQAQIELLSRMAWIQREHLQQPADAIGTLTRSQRLDGNHLPTLLTLGELHLSLEQWQEAAEAYARIVAVSDDPDVLRSAHFRLGDLWGDKLGDARRAISSYQNVLAIAPNDVAALTKLFELFSRNKDWENAAEAIGRLIEVESEPRLLVSHYAALAEIQEKGFGDPRLAAEQLERALSIEPTNETILGRLARLSTQLGNWEPLADAIRSYLVALPADQEGRGIHYRLQLGEILRRRLGRTAEALEQFRAVVEIDPTHVDARLSIAGILAEDGRYEEAIAEHREVQSLDGLNLESLRQMRVLWSRLGNHDMAYAAAAALVCLGGAQEADEQLYRERRAKGVRFPQSGDPMLLEKSLPHPGENPAGRRVLAVLGEIAHRLRPPELAEWHVSRADRLAPRSEDPLKLVVHEVSMVLGIDREVEIYISPSRTREMDLLLTDPPSLVVGAGVMASFSSLEVRFWTGLLLSFVRSRTFAGYGLSGPELGRLVRAALLACEGENVSDENPFASVARAIQRNLSRRGRRQLEEAGRAYSSAREADLDEWAMAMQHSALRTALWLVGDLETALDFLRRTDPTLSKPGEGGQLLVRRSPLATEVLHYWLSDEYLSLRRSSQG